MQDQIPKSVVGLWYSANPQQLPSIENASILDTKPNTKYQIPITGFHGRGRLARRARCIRRRGMFAKTWLSGGVERSDTKNDGLLAQAVKVW